jgi:lysophospholipase L1-like esterase
LKDVKICIRYNLIRGEVRDNQCGDYQYADDICNGLGLRGELPDKKKKIILFLGDSFTEGAGAPVDSSVPELLRKYVVSNDSTSDVLNAGIAGNDIFF